MNNQNDADLDAKIKESQEKLLDKAQEQLVKDVTETIAEFKFLLTNINVGEQFFSGRYNVMTNEITLTDKKRTDAQNAMALNPNTKAEIYIYAPGETFTEVTSDSGFSKLSGSTHKNILDFYSDTIANLTQMPVLKIETVTGSPKP